MRKRILYLDRLRFFAILTIILLHIIALFRWKNFNVNQTNYFILTFLDSFTRVGIPIFFMLTGSLMFNKKDEKYKDFFTKRVLKLIIAYFSFCLVYYVYNVLTGVYSFSIYEFLRLSTSGSIAYHLWFMPIIIIIYIFIPFIKKIVLNLNNKELFNMISIIFVLGNCLIGIEAILERYNYYLLGNFTLPYLITYTNYLFIGYYLSQNELKINKKLVIASIISIILIPLLTLLVSTNTLNDVFLNSVSPLVVLPSVLVFLLFKNSKVEVTKLDQFIIRNINNIFYVYLIHALIINIIQLLFKGINTNMNIIIDLLLIPLLFIIVTLVSFGIMNLYRYIVKVITKNYKKILKIILTAFSAIFIMIYTIVLINLFVNPYNFIRINYFVLIISSIVYILLFILICKYQNKIFKNSIVNKIFICLYFAFQLTVASMFAVKPSWDFGAVFEIAEVFAESSKITFGASYLYLADNNIPLTVLLDIIFRVCRIIHPLCNYLSIGIMFNIIMIDISLVYTYLLINKLNSKYSKVFMLFCLFFTPLLLYTPIFYSDTLTMPFTIVPIYYFYKYINEKDKKIYLVISSLLFGLGGLIKPTVLIPAIAIIIYQILFNKKIKVIPLIIIGIMIPFIGYKIFLNQFFVVEYIKENCIPKNHYIMIGLEGNGGFSQEAYLFTNSFADPNERKTAVQERINNRLKEMKEKHLFLKFFNRKISYTWTDGSLFVFDVINRKPFHPGFIMITVNNDNKMNLCWTISDLEWIIIIVLWILAMIYNRYLSNNLKELNFILSLSIFGLFIFLIIWETRSRYLVNYIPLFFVNSYIGLNALINYIETRRVNNEK